MEENNTCGWPWMICWDFIAYPETVGIRFCCCCCELVSDLESKGRKVQHFEATRLDEHSRSCVSTFFSSCLIAKKRDWQGIFAIEVKNKWDKLRISEALKGTFEHMEIQKLFNNTKNSLHLVEHLFLNGSLICFACQLGSQTHRNGFT